MPISVIVTPGAADANSYCSKAEADTYHAAHPYGSTWTDHDGEDLQLQALILATQLLDEQMEWFGTVVDDVQALLWPRSGVEGLNGYELDDTTIPAKLRDATAEFARQLLAADRTADSDLETYDIKNLKVASIELTFGSPGAKVMPDSVYMKVQHLGRQRGQHGVAQVYRV